jgi:hypothetical protein
MMSDEAALDLAWETFREREPNTDRKRFAVYSLQYGNLQLKPWQRPPVQLDLDADPRSCDCQKILKRMARAGISRFHPNPLAALAARQRARR